MKSAIRVKRVETRPRTPNLKNMVFDLCWGGPVFDGLFLSLVTKMLFHFFVKKKTFSSGHGPHVCTLSGQPSLPCSKLQLMKNVDLQPREWSASRGQFGGWRRHCD